MNVRQGCAPAGKFDSVIRSFVRFDAKRLRRLLVYFHAGNAGMGYSYAA